MFGNTIHAGELNIQIEFFKRTYSDSSTSERTKTDVSVGKMKAKRIDVTGTEEDQGKLVGLKVCRFITRFSKDLLDNGDDYFIRDIDGDFDVNNVSITGPGRNRFLEFKCSSVEKD